MVDENEGKDFSLSLFIISNWLNLLSIIQIIIQVILMKGRCNYIEIGIQTILASACCFSENLPVFGREVS